MECRSMYGYYGESGGITGEQAPIAHASGWRFDKYFFEISGTFEQTQGCTRIEIKACDYAHALKQARKWARRDGFKLVLVDEKRR